MQWETSITSKSWLKRYSGSLKFVALLGTSFEARYHQGFPDCKREALVPCDTEVNQLVHKPVCSTACRKFEENALAEPIERRWVKTPDGLYDPDAVPPEWYQWLRKRRDEAPSLQEVEQYVNCLFGIIVVLLKGKQHDMTMLCTAHFGNLIEHMYAWSDTCIWYTRMGSHRVQIRQKAAALDAEEAKRRFQVAA